MMPSERGKDQRGAVAIPTGNWRLFPLAIVSGIFVVAGCFMIAKGSFQITIFGLLIVVVFGFCLLRLSFLLFARKSSLVISESGIFDNGSAIAAGFIPWAEIEGIYVPPFSSEAFMRIFVRDIENILARLSSWKVRIMRLNSSLTGSYINVPVGVLRINREELIALMRAKNPDVFIIPDDETS